MSVTAFKPSPQRTAPLTAQLLASARDLAGWHEDQGRSGTATTIYHLVWEIEWLREAAKGSLVIVQQAGTMAKLAELKASTLLIVAQKLAPVVDREIEERKHSGNSEDWVALQALSDELHASIRLAKG